MRTRIIAVSILVILSVSFPINKAIDIEVNVVKYENHKRTKATFKEKQKNIALAKSYASAGWDWRGAQWLCAKSLFTKESRFDNYADNPNSTAFGIGQVLGEKSTDPAIQLLHAYKYIEHRYKTPCKALAFHNRRNHY